MGIEKKTAHYRLDVVKVLVEEDRLYVTQTALAGAAALGLNFEDIKYVINSLEAGDFYKSMTSHGDHTLWQDVYHFPSEGAGDVYIKFAVIDHLLVLSFKEL
jgi:motility quorum-sensing regulator/GCU-specific mRNA interferase toxin